MYKRIISIYTRIYLLTHFGFGFKISVVRIIVAGKQILIKDYSFFINETFTFGRYSVTVSTLNKRGKPFGGCI